MPFAMTVVLDTHGRPRRSAGLGRSHDARGDDHPRSIHHRAGPRPNRRFTARRSPGRERFYLPGRAPALGALPWVDPGGPERVHHRAHGSLCPRQPMPTAASALRRTECGAPIIHAMGCGSSRGTGRRLSSRAAFEPPAGHWMLFSNCFASTTTSSMRPGVRGQSQVTGAAL